MRFETRLLLLLFCLVPLPASAYLDGGTISMALQLIAGGIGIGLLFIRRWLHFIRDLVSKKLAKTEPENESAENK